MTPRCYSCKRPLGSPYKSCLNPVAHSQAAFIAGGIVTGPGLVRIEAGEQIVPVP